MANKSRTQRLLDSMHIIAPGVSHRGNGISGSGGGISTAMSEALTSIIDSISRLPPTPPALNISFEDEDIIPFSPPGPPGERGLQGPPGSQGPMSLEPEERELIPVTPVPIDTDSSILIYDSTVNNVSAAKHGFTPKLPNDSTKYLDGTGAYSVPPGSGGSGALTQISRQVLGADATAVSFTSIPGTYNHLKLVISGRATTLLTATNVFIQFNADTSAHYDYQYSLGTHTSVLAADALAQTAGLIGFIADDGAARAASKSTLDILIPDYIDTAFEKIATATSGTASGTVAGAIYASLHTVNWRSAAAITRIDLTCGLKFKTGSIFTLYGMA